MSCPFFHDYDQFLVIEIASKDLNEFHKWKGLIQARLRYLVGGFEQDHDEKINFQLWPQEFNLYLANQAEWKYACFYYIGVKTTSQSIENISLTSAFNSWKKAVFEQWEGEPTSNNVSINPKRRSELDKFVYNYNAVLPSPGPPKGFLRWEETRNISSFEKEPSNILSKMPTDHQSLAAQVGPNNLGLLMGNFTQGQPPMGLIPFSQHSYGSPNLGQGGMGVSKAPFGSTEFYGDPNNSVPAAGFPANGTRSPPGQILASNGFPVHLISGYLPKHQILQGGQPPAPNSFMGGPMRPSFPPGMMNQPLMSDPLLPGQPQLVQLPNNVILGHQQTMQIQVDSPFSLPPEQLDPQPGNTAQQDPKQGNS